jgi:GTP pyrophosphokinase
MIYQEKMDLVEMKRFLLGESTRAEEAKSAPSKESTLAKTKTQTQEQDDVLFLDANLKKVNYKLAKCCNPLPGDPVFGFVTISRGITIHHQNCPNAKQLLTRFGYRKIDVKWKGLEDKDSFRTTIKVTGIDRIGLMNEISQIISNDLKFNMISLKVEARKGAFTGIIKLQVLSKGSLSDLLQKISLVNGVSKAVKID